MIPLARPIPGEPNFPSRLEELSAFSPKKLKHDRSFSKVDHRFTHGQANAQRGNAGRRCCPPSRASRRAVPESLKRRG
jgi:hypothetical protein